MAFRLDKGSLNPPRKLADGRIVVDGRLTRTGVFVYHDSAGKERREYRPAEEVFRSDSLESFAWAPVTDDHPKEPVNAQNARTYAVGQVSNAVKQDGDFVVASLVINDASTIAKMEAGKVQLSCGYEVDLVETPGVAPSGERYDAIQTNIRGNHVALVEIGRAGPEVCVRMDAWQQVETTEETTMDMKLLNETFDRAVKAEQLLAEAQKRIDSLSAEVDSLKAAVSQADAQRNDAESVFEARVQARVELVATAQRFDVATQGSDRDLKIAVIQKLDSVEISADKSDDYLNAYFESAVKRADAAQKTLDSARTIVDNPNVTPVDAEEVARQRMLERSRNAYKGN